MHATPLPVLFLQVLHHAALSYNIPPWVAALSKTLGPGLILLLLALAWRYVYAGTTDIFGYSGWSLSVEYIL